MNIRGALHGFPDMGRQPPDSLDALLGEGIHLRLQFRDEVHLGWIERYGSQPQPDILLKNEGKVSQKQRSLKGGRGDRISNQTAERFALCGDHGNDLSRRSPANLGRRKTQDARIEVEPEPAQHTFPQHTLIDIQVVLETPRCHHSHEECDRKQHQETNLRDLKTEYRFRQILAIDGLVDNSLRNVQRDVDQRHRQDSQKQQEQLAPKGVPQDIAIDRLIYSGIIRVIPRG